MSNDATAELTEAFTATLECFTREAVAIARRHNWCSDWYLTFTRLSRAFSVVSDRDGFRGYRVVIDAAKVVAPPAMGVLDFMADLTEGGRAKIQDRTSAAITEELLLIRNRVADLAGNDTITMDDANTAITALGDTEAYPLITQSPADMYAYLPVITFTPVPGVAPSVYNERLGEVMKAWMATGPEIEGVTNLAFNDEQPRGDTYERRRRTQYGDRVALLSSRR
jgi:hypothetical protein